MAAPPDDYKLEDVPPEIMMMMLYESGADTLDLSDILNFAQAARWTYNVSLGDTYGRALARMKLPIERNIVDKDWAALAVARAQRIVSDDDVKSALDCAMWRLFGGKRLFDRHVVPNADIPFLTSVHADRRGTKVAGGLATLLSDFVVSRPPLRSKSYLGVTYAVKSTAYLASYLNPETSKIGIVVETLGALFSRAKDEMDFVWDRNPSPQKAVYAVIKSLVKQRMYIALWELIGLGFVSVGQVNAFINLSMPGDVLEAEALINIIEAAVAVVEEDPDATYESLSGPTRVWSGLDENLVHNLAALVWCGGGGAVAVDRGVFYARLADRVVNVFYRFTAMMDMRIAAFGGSGAAKFNAWFWLCNAVFLAAHWANDAVWELLLDSGLRERVNEPLVWREWANVSVPGTPLHLAVASLSLGAVQRLVAAGADLEAALGNDNRTPLEEAFLMRNTNFSGFRSTAVAAAKVEIMAFLVQAGADASVVSDPRFASWLQEQDKVEDVRVEHTFLAYAPPNQV